MCIRDSCDAHHVPLIEDAAESLSSTFRGKMTGTFGDYGIFSFNGNKIITTSGGGMLVSRDGEAIEKARFLSTQARDKARHYQHSQLSLIHIEMCIRDSCIPVRSAFPHAPETI